ncbi:MAG: ATP-binding protein [Bacillota bacterium]
MKGKLRFKILSVFIIVFIVLIGNSLWSVYNFNQLSQSIENIMISNYKTIEAAQDMIVALERQDSAELSYMFAEDNNANDLFRTNEKEFLKELSIAENNITEPGEEKILDNINKLYTNYLDKFYKLQEIQSNKDYQSARDYYYNEILPLFEKAKEKTRELLELNQNGMVNRKNNASLIANRAIYSTITISILTILFGLIIAIYLVNQIITPIYSLIEKVKKIASGNYEQKIEVKGNDEISKLAKEFNIMTTKLKSYKQLNVKKLKAENQKTEAIVESIEDAIIVTDKNNNISKVNREAERIFDVRESEVIGKHFLEVFNNEEIFEKIKEAQKDHEFNNYEKPVDLSLQNNENESFFRVYSRTIITKDNEKLGVVTLLQNITKLKEVDQMKSNFVSTVSHEFRTPLTSISMSVGLLLDRTPGELSKDQLELVKAIEEDSERLKNLVSDLLDLSKLESGKIQMNFETCNIKKIIKSAVNPFEKQFEEKDARLIYDEAIKDIYVKADYNKVSWVLTNLIGNALRYVPSDGEGKVEIEIKESNNTIYVTVQDNGQGIPKNKQNNIFEKFTQIKGDDKSGSTGLGLAISKEIIEAHNGDIWVESEKGKGSKFYFTLHKK